MNKAIILGTTILIILLVAYLKNKSKKEKNYKYRTGGFISDNNWNKVKEIQPINCIRGGECQVASNRCCANCQQANTLLADDHCPKHEHNHSHHHHSIDNEKYLNLLFISMTLGTIIFFGIRKVINQIRRQNDQK